MSQPAVPVGPYGRWFAPALSVLAVVALVGALLLFSRGKAPVVHKSVLQLDRHSHSQPKALQPSAPPAAGGRHPAVSRHPVQRPSAAAQPAVTVLNNSRIYHLAAHVAGELQARGWPIAATGNLTGRLPETTLFFAQGEWNAAHSLAQAFPEITTIRPRPAGLPGGALTLVVTRYWES